MAAAAVAATATAMAMAMAGPRWWWVLIGINAAHARVWRGRRQRRRQAISNDLDAGGGGRRRTSQRRRALLMGGEVEVLISRPPKSDHLSFARQGSHTELPTTLRSPAVLVLLHVGIVRVHLANLNKQ